MRKTINIFRAGHHTAMSGHTLHFSETDLSMSASTYNPQVHAAPLVLGHPVNNLPAYGRVLGVKVRGSQMFADVDASDALVGLVRQGAYGRVSAAFFTPKAPDNPRPGAYYLRHVGFLGSAPPAIKGLERPEFAAADEGALCFAEGGPLPTGFKDTTPQAVARTPDPSTDPEGFNKAVLALLKANPAMTYRDAMAQLLGEQAQQRLDRHMTASADPQRMALHMSVRGVQQQNPQLSYAEALDVAFIF